MNFARLSTLLASAFAWSENGHRIVASEASMRLHSSAESLITHHLLVPDGTVESALRLASTWADEFAISEPLTRRLHFVYTPDRDCEAYNAERDCPDGECIVAAIGRFSQIAIDLDQSRANRIEAIKFLIHLMADIHQPLHVSFRQDAGGNGIQLGSPDLTLHEVWDRIPDGAVPAATAPSDKNRPEVNWEDQESVEAYAAWIASETSMSYTCKAAYKHAGASTAWIESGDTLSEQYEKRHKFVVNIQLTQAGRRLSELLNGLGKIYMQRYQLLHPSSVTYAIPEAVLESIPTSNRFAGLEIDEDFDEEAVLARSDMETSEVSSSSTALVLPHSIKKYQPNMFQGVDLASLVLMRHPVFHHLIITSRNLRKKGFDSMHFTVINVRFRNSARPIEFSFDAGCFGLPPYSDDLIVRALGAVRGKAFKVPHRRGVESVTEIKTRYQVNGSIVAGEFTFVGGPRSNTKDFRDEAGSLIHLFFIEQQKREGKTEAELEAISLEQLLQNRHSIVAVNFRKVTFFTTLEALRAPATAPVHVSVVWAFDGRTVHAHLIDKRLCISSSGGGNVELLNSLANENSSHKNAVQKQFRPLMGNELANLDIFLFDNKPDRWARFDVVDTLVDMDPSASTLGEIVWKVGDPFAPIKRIPTLEF